ncbi:hypothetical protein ACFV06_02335 [Streptomyces sp. NPDC059618]|uniref:hypothetical protein n=1 Tax=Streptomyces sp. NPDC059618 TaxID=3346887 RepID=UPI00369EF731
MTAPDPLDTWSVRIAERVAPGESAFAAQTARAYAAGGASRRSLFSSSGQVPGGMGGGAVSVLPAVLDALAYAADHLRSALGSPELNNLLSATGLLVGIRAQRSAEAATRRPGGDHGPSDNDAIPPAPQADGRGPAGEDLSGAAVSPGGADPSGAPQVGAAPAAVSPSGADPAALPPGGAEPSGAPQVGADQAALPPGGAEPSGAPQVGATPAAVLPGGAVPADVSPGGADPAALPPGGAEPSGAPQVGADQAALPPGGAEPSGAPQAGATPAAVLPGGAVPADVPPGGADPVSVAPTFDVLRAALHMSGRLRARGLAPGDADELAARLVVRLVTEDDPAEVVAFLDALASEEPPPPPRAPDTRCRKLRRLRSAASGLLLRPGRPRTAGPRPAAGPEGTHEG